jgi:peroxiredoxin
LNFNELENKDLNAAPKQKSEPQPQQQQTLVAQQQEYQPMSRSPQDWKLILKLSVILALLAGLFIGSVIGFFTGKAIFQQTTVVQQQQDPEDTENSIFSQFDYSKIVINEDKKVTVENFYNDDEERFYAMQLIGQPIPELSYIDSEENTFNVNDLGDGQYILEFIEPDCTFCNGMISLIDEYRAKENSINVIGLSIKEGDISAFNKEGETSFMLVNDDETEKIDKYIAWVPTFMYVENGTIKLVYFGRMDMETFENNIDVAFN